MKSLRLYILGPLSILCFQITAQVEDLMKDKNITWMAESYNDFVTEGIMQDKIGNPMNQVIPLKFLNTNEEIVPENFILQRLLIEAVQADKLLIYKDAECELLTSYENLIHRNEVRVDDSTTYETRTCVSYDIPSAKQMLFFRTRQILYYDSIKVQFGLRTLAIAPMTKVLNEAGEIINWKPLFWMKATDLTEKRRLSDESITWAAQISSHNDIDLRKDSTKLLKSSDDYSPKQPLFRAFYEDEKISFYKPNGKDMTTKFDLAERKEFFEGRDTILTINPTNYQTETKIVFRCFPMFDYNYLGLIQNWYWDDKKKSLEIYLSATSILKDVRNEAGDFLYKRPYFYRRTDD
jgi:Gliding motility associated protein GldN